MKNKFIKSLTVGVAVLLACGMLAGCEKEKAGESSSSMPTETQTETKVVTDRIYAKDLDLDKYVTLKDYQNFRVARDEVTVSEDELNELLNDVYRNSFPSDLGIKDRAVALGDYVKIDYEGKKDGVAFDGGTAQDQTLGIGTGTFIDGFEDGLVGVMPGETVELNLTFPENYQSAELAGQDVVFTVTVHSIIPEEMIDEAVAGIVEGIDTVADLRQYIYDYLYQVALKEDQDNYEDKIFDAFLEQMCEIKEVPSNLYDYYKNTVYNELVTYSLQAGTTPEGLVQTYYGMALEDFLANYADIASRREIVMLAVAKKEGLILEDGEELDKTLAQVASDYGEESAEAFLTNNGLTKEDFKEDYAYEQALLYVLDLAQKQ